MRFNSTLAALADIDRMEKENTIRFRHARRLLEAGRSRALFIPDHIGHCDFAGHLLVSVIDRKGEAAVYVQDADDWGMELVVQDIASAESIFDDLFRQRPPYDKDLEDKLKLYGFTRI